MSVWERVLAAAGFTAADDPIGADGAWTDRGLDDSVAIDDLFAAATVGLQLVADDVDHAPPSLTGDGASESAAEQSDGDGLVIDDDLDDDDPDDDPERDDIAGGVRKRALVNRDEPTPVTSADEPVDIEDTQPAAVESDSLPDHHGDSDGLLPVSLEPGVIDVAAPEIDDDGPVTRELDDDGADE